MGVPQGPRPSRIRSCFGFRWLSLGPPPHRGSPPWGFAQTRLGLRVDEERAWRHDSPPLERANGHSQADQGPGPFHQQDSRVGRCQGRDGKQRGTREVEQPVGDSVGAHAGVLACAEGGQDQEPPLRSRRTESGSSPSVESSQRPDFRPLTRGTLPRRGLKRQRDDFGSGSRRRNCSGGRSSLVKNLTARIEMQMKGPFNSDDD